MAMSNLASMYAAVVLAVKAVLRAYKAPVATTLEGQLQEVRVATASLEMCVESFASAIRGAREWHINRRIDRVANSKRRDKPKAIRRLLKVDDREFAMRLLERIQRLNSPFVEGEPDWCGYTPRLYEVSLVERATYPEESDCIRVEVSLQVPLQAVDDAWEQALEENVERACVGLDWMAQHSLREKYENDRRRRLYGDD